MFEEKRIAHISKFLSLILRHKPETINLDLDNNGWADVPTLLEKSNSHGVQFDFELLKYVVDTNAKKRFAFNETFDKIRASQGHSIAIDLGYKNQMPPKILYHGTCEKSVESIRNSGLEKRDRQHVHLSNDRETAINVGKRHGKPFVFEIMAQQMYHDEYEFFIAANGVWLTDNVPSKYIK